MTHCLQEIPQCFGVYMLRDWQEQIIYVGSSLDKKGGMRKRISRYFSKYNASLRIYPYEISGVLWKQCDAPREIEKEIIGHLLKTGAPLRNATLFKSTRSDAFCRSMLSRFTFANVWKDPAEAKEIGAQSHQHLKPLIGGLNNAISAPIDSVTVATPVAPPIPKSAGFHNLTVKVDDRMYRSLRAHCWKQERETDERVTHQEILEKALSLYLARASR